VDGRKKFVHRVDLTPETGYRNLGGAYAVWIGASV